MEASSQSTERIINSLLPFTVENAAQLKFYKDIWRDCDLKTIRSVQDLPRLPTVSKDQYRLGLMFEEQATRHAAWVSHSTGTTGELTWRHRSLGEAALIARLFQPATTGAAPLVLSVQATRHGMALPVPSRGRSVPVSVTDDVEVGQCLKMLTATYRFSDGAAKPSAIAGGGLDVALIAQAAIEAGLTSQRSEIMHLYLGSYVDAGLKAFLAASFPNAAIVEKYSLSEIFGGATRTSSPLYGLDPFVIGEVLDEQGNPVVDGVPGELVLTELYPLIQMQPLVRYRTGDIVVATHVFPGQPNFSWWGRRHQCIGKGDDWILGYSPLADWLSTQPFVSRFLHRPYLESVRSTDLGPPCFSMDMDEGGTVRITIGVRENPWWPSVLAQRFVDSLWAKLREIVMPRHMSIRVSVRLHHMLQPASILNDVLRSPALQLETKSLGGPSPRVAEGETRSRSADTAYRDHPLNGG